MKPYLQETAGQRDQQKRLARIRGQVDGIGRMIEQDRHCVDILVQLRAVQAALRKVEEQVLRGHVEHCITTALESPDDEQGRKKLDELFDVLRRYGM
ncbi:MAG TPA: metal-sensitive transcriptional regulator [Gammaproteobacteria bacterium]